MKFRHLRTFAIILGLGSLGVAITGLWGTQIFAAKSAKVESGMGPEGDHWKGSASAKAVLTEFTDFECPYCQKFHERLKEAMAAVGSQNVKVVFRNWPLPFHANAMRLAVAARCAGAQERFWDYADWIYATADETIDAPKKRSEAFADANLIAQAEKMGLARDRFGSCIKSQSEVSKIENDARDGQKLGGTGTPFILINGKKWEGNWIKSGELEKALKEAAK